MKLPESIQLELRTANGAGVHDIIVFMKVRAGTKNAYQIYFPKTDKSGKATLTSEEFIGQFKDHHESGLMDYNGSVTEAEQAVILSLFNVSAAKSRKNQLLAWPLLANEKKVWKSREEHVQYLLSCRNEEYAGPEIPVDLAPQLTYEITKKLI